LAFRAFDLEPRDSSVNAHGSDSDWQDIVIAFQETLAVNFRLQWCNCHIGFSTCERMKAFVVCIVSTLAIYQGESFFLQRSICEITRRALFKGLPQPSREKQYQILSICQHLNVDLFLACHKQEPCHAVNKNILAGTMPRKRQGKASGEHDKASETLLRYIAI
jgi:hypothetical protein